VSARVRPLPPVFRASFPDAPLSTLKINRLLTFHAEHLAPGVMQVLITLPTDAVEVLLDTMLSIWPPSAVLTHLWKLPGSFVDVWLCRQKVLNMKHSDIPVASLQRLFSRLQQNPSISGLYLPAKVMETAGLSETIDVLHSLDNVVDVLPNLRFLSIHGLHLRQEHTPVLASLCRALRSKLKGLSLSLKEWEFGGFDGQRFLLEAIGKLSKLEMLEFLDLEEFLGDSTHLLRSLARWRALEVLVRDEPSQGFVAAVSAMAPDVRIQKTFNHWVDYWH
jgi:hypothetical protein